MKRELYDVWRVHYATYEELAWQGDIKQVLVKRGLTYEKALEMVAAYGAEYCAKPQP